MIGSVERYSSTTRRRRVAVAVGRLLRGLLIAFLLFLVTTRFLASTFRVDSVSMRPALAPADRVVVSYLDYGGRLPFTAARLPGTGGPQRGDLVVVQPPFIDEPRLLERLFEPVARFFTAQRGTLRRSLSNGRVDSYMVKRLIGMPGDTIRMSGYLVSVKPSGEAQFVPEQQIVPGRYEVTAGDPAPGWEASLPASGTVPDLVLGADQFYVLGDNRRESSDSRSWGALDGARIIGKVVWRYWPPRAFGRI